MMASLIGHVIAGRYQILAALGEGGMASVYKGHDLRLDRDVAIKVIRSGQDETNDFLQRFEREAKALAKLSHPNIVQIHDYGEYDGRPYLVMEYVPGGTLQSRMGQPVPYRQAARWLAPVARSLEYSHHHNIIHRDVKPANMLFNENGDLLLSDFGVVKILGGQSGATLTSTGTGVGTPGYMAPEQWMGTPVFQTDIYALGVVFYELVTGVQPFTANTPAAVFLKHLNQAPTSPRLIQPGLPPEVEAVINTALQKKPEQRFAAMGEFAQKLEELAQGIFTAPAGSATSVEIPAARPAVPPTKPVPPTGPPREAVSQPSGTPPPRATPAPGVRSPVVPASGPQATLPTPVPTQFAGQTQVSSTLPPPVATQVAPYSSPPVKKKGSNRTLVLALAAGGIGLVAIAAILLVVFLVILAPKNRPGQLSSSSTLPEATSTQPPTSEPAATPTLLPTEAPTQAPTAPLAANTPPNCAKPEVFCVGLVTDGGTIDDNGFNQSAWSGVQQAVKELGAFGQFIETSNSADFLTNIAQFGNARYDVIVTVGFTMADVTTLAAQKYPDVHFIAIDQDQTQPLPNVAGLVFPEDQSGFLAGALAAQMSKTGKIAAVLGPDSVPPVWRYGEGYKAGARYARPNIQVTLVYHNDASMDIAFNDPDWGKATALELVKINNDVIFGAGGITGNGAIQAAAEKGVMVIGVDLDQYFGLPSVRPVLLTSAIKLLSPGVFNLINLAQQGKFPTGDFQGQGGIAPYHDMDSKIPADVKARQQKLIQDLANGVVKTGVLPARP